MTLLKPKVAYLHLPLIRPLRCLLEDNRSLNISQHLTSAISLDWLYCGSAAHQPSSALPPSSGCILAITSAVLLCRVRVSKLPNFLFLGLVPHFGGTPPLLSKEKKKKEEMKVSKPFRSKYIIHTLTLDCLIVG